MSKRLRVSMEVISGIYEIINTVSGNIYVGSSKDIYGRWVQHQGDLNRHKHYNEHLQRAWDLYGKGSFEFKVLECTENTIQTLFEREQFWYDYYRDNGVILYNESPIAATSTAPATIEDLQNGKRKTTYKQFVEICSLLKDTNLPFYKIAEKTGSHVNQIYQIYKRTYFANLTEGMLFQERKNSGENHVHAKLSKEDVLNIIQKMLDGKYTTDLCKEYNVSPATIDDIRQHKTWCELTDGINFPHPRKNGCDGKPVVQYDLDGNFITEYKNAREAERVTGISYKLISRVCLGQRKQTHGFIFAFKTQQNN